MPKWRREEPLAKRDSPLARLRPTAGADLFRPLFRTRLQELHDDLDAPRPFVRLLGGGVDPPDIGLAVELGEVVEEGRGAKILVFHYKRKKQYRKLRGHRQSFSAVRITEIAYEGQSFKAPVVPKKEPKPKKAEAAGETKTAAPKAAKKKKAAKTTGGKKSSAKKKK